MRRYRVVDNATMVQIMDLVEFSTLNRPADFEHFRVEFGTARPHKIGDYGFPKQTSAKSGGQFCFSVETLLFELEQVIPEELIRHLDDPVETAAAEGSVGGSGKAGKGQSRQQQQKEKQQKQAEQKQQAGQQQKKKQKQSEEQQKQAEQQQQKKKKQEEAEQQQQQAEQEENPSKDLALRLWRQVVRGGGKAVVNCIYPVGVEKKSHIWQLVELLRKGEWGREVAGELLDLYENTGLYIAVAGTWTGLHLDWTEAFNIGWLTVVSRHGQGWALTGLWQGMAWRVKRWVQLGIGMA